jgi:hypothetical protein
VLGQAVFLQAICTTVGGEPVPLLQQDDLCLQLGDGLLCLGIDLLLLLQDYLHI